MCINIFRGTIPNEIGGLADLRFLQLDSNSLTGTIPSQLGQLDMLIFMSAADLQLNGIMPSQVCVNRGEPNNPDNGNLAVLIVDCDPADQKVGDYLLGPLQFTSFYVNQYMHNRYSVNAAPIVVFKSKVQLFHNSPRSGLRSKEMNWAKISHCLSTPFVRMKHLVLYFHLFIYVTHSVKHISCNIVL
jgi:hypothetical protein